MQTIKTMKDLTRTSLRVQMAVRDFDHLSCQGNHERIGADLVKTRIDAQMNFSRIFFCVAEIMDSRDCAHKVRPKERGTVLQVKMQFPRILE